MQDERRTSYYRWTFGLFGGYFILAAILAVVLLATITDSNAGYPALFFSGLYALAGLPVFVTSAVLAGKSLARREPYRLAVLGVLAGSSLLAWLLLSRIVQGIWVQLT